VLEYCPHGNLMDYINQKKKIGESIAVDIMQQILSAYKYLLEEGIIHRDLKPANILRIGNKWKIADFGFAVKSRFEFKDRINVGTPLYMPL
jgi:serine/threonine protein kinase